MTWGDMDTRTSLIIAVTKALTEAMRLKAAAIESPKVSVSTLNKSTNTWSTPTKQPIPIFNGGDEIEYTEYTTPSIVIFNPRLEEHREIITNRPAYRDYDYDNLEVKEFQEPIPIKLRYKIHAATRNPENDGLLQLFLMKLRRTMSILDIPVVPSKEEYDRVELIWYDPDELDSEDVSRIREFEVEVRTWLEVLEYKTVRLIQPGDGYVLTVDNYKLSGYWLNAKISHDIYAATTEIRINGFTTGFPVFGRCMIDDGEIFTYTGKTHSVFTGVTGITHFYPYDTEIVYINED